MLGHTGVLEALLQSVSSGTRPDWHQPLPPACLPFFLTPQSTALYLPLSLVEEVVRRMATFPRSLLPQVSRIRVRQHLKRL